MAATSKEPCEFVVLYGVPWEVYEGILAALDEHPLRHAYDNGALEIRSTVLGVSWNEYKQFVDGLGDFSLRHTYDGWALEMMSPLKAHDWDKRFIGRIIETIAFELDIDIQCIGSTTLTSAAVERGLQPDESYYIANELRVRGKYVYEPDKDPPPDLIVEVDVTNSSVPRMPLFAQMRIPEVWRYDGERTCFYHLQKKRTYRQVKYSLAFPFLQPADVDQCVGELSERSENAVLRSLIQRLRERLESSEFTKGKK